MTRAQIVGKDAVFEVPRKSGHPEHGIYTSELWDSGPNVAAAAVPFCRF
ncbi:MAG TPA: hypothetical protein VM580_28175 [Labilithrix sp.]|nr:hypothetical protein [Labilithrix sp.]